MREESVSVIDCDVAIAAVVPGTGRLGKAARPRAILPYTQGALSRYNGAAMTQSQSESVTAAVDEAPDISFRGAPLRVMQVMAGAAHGGAETQFQNLVLALHRAGLDQRAVIRHDPARAAALRAGGVEPLELAFGSWTDLATVPALKREVAAYRPDVVLTWMNRASKMFPAGDFLRLGRLGGYYDLKYYRRCDHLIGNTQDIVEHVVRHGWPRARAHLMLNFASIRDLPAVSRAALNTPQEAKVVVALGRLHEAKAFDTLLQALAVERRPYLWLAGEGPLRRELEGLAGKLGIADRVRFLGWRDDREALFAAADMCIVPSRYEPFGSVIIEAWAHHLPLAATVSAGPAALISDGGDGLLVPIDDVTAMAAALTRLMDEAGLGPRLVEAGWQRYQTDFTEAAAVARWLGLFHRLLAARADTRAAAG
jgi:glycosyltransferase involved in cell wall biosynthesis